MMLYVVFYRFCFVILYGEREGDRDRERQTDRQTEREKRDRQIMKYKQEM